MFDLPLLGDADLPVPPKSRRKWLKSHETGLKKSLLPPPLLGGSKHASSSAHVSKGSLARPAFENSFQIKPKQNNNYRL